MTQYSEAFKSKMVQRMLGPRATSATGLVLAEALVGHAVYGTGSAIAIALAQRSDDPPPLPRGVVDSPLGTVIVGATQKRPSLRFGSAEEMLAAIGRRGSALEPGHRSTVGGPADSDSDCPICRLRAGSDGRRHEYGG